MKQEVRDPILLAIEAQRHQSDLQLLRRSPLAAFRQKPYLLFLASLGLALVFAVVARLLGASLIDVLIFVALLAILPPALFNFTQTRKVKRTESEFPSLLRDITLSMKAGMTLKGALNIAAGGQYGALTPAVVHIDKMMSWGISFEEALLYLAHRYPTSLIKRSVATIIEASKIGGEIGDILDNVATDAEETRTLQKKRGSETAPYIVVCYLSYFIFLAIIVVISVTLFPMMETMGKEAGAAALEGTLTVTVKEGQLATYKRLFFHALVLQGFFAGIITGKIGEGSMLAGLKHSLFFVTVALLANAFVM